VLGAEIDRRFFDTPYYVTPNDPVGQERPLHSRPRPVSVA
jgi:non-homologous end joining protein Ku